MERRIREGILDTWLAFGRTLCRNISFGGVNCGISGDLFVTSRGVRNLWGLRSEGVIPRSRRRRIALLSGQICVTSRMASLER